MWDFIIVGAIVCIAALFAISRLFRRTPSCGCAGSCSTSACNSRHDNALKMGAAHQCGCSSGNSATSGNAAAGNDSATCGNAAAETASHPAGSSCCGGKNCKSADTTASKP